MSPGKEKNYYTILQVDQTASPAVIQGAYRALLKIAAIHPDLGGSSAEAQAINEAYAVLSNPETRREYDGLLSFSPPIDVELPETRYILICPSCRNRNQVRDERKIKRARCGACGHLLVPRRHAGQEQDDERAFRLGIYLFDKRLYDRALREFQAAVRVKPRNAPYHYWLGRCYYQKRVLESSRSAFNSAALLEPKQFHFHFWLGQTNYALKDFAGAMAGFAAGARLRKDHTPTLLKLSSCYFRLREYEKAIATLKRAIRKEPTRLQTHLWLGLSYLASSDPKAALGAFKRAEKLGPENPITRKYLRLCQAEIAGEPLTAG
jgi:tetratricopeptide (TPR) repeat protein